MQEPVTLALAAFCVWQHFTVTVMGSVKAAAANPLAESAAIALTASVSVSSLVVSVADRVPAMEHSYR